MKNMLTKCINLFFTQKLYSHRLLRVSVDRKLLKLLCRPASQNARVKADFHDVTFWSGKYYLLVFPLTSLYLSYWQIQRKKWKEDLIQDLQDRRNRPPIEIPANLEALKSIEMEFQPIRVSGEFDYSREVYLGPRTETASVSGGVQGRVAGVHVVTPFKLEGRDLTILVNRGFYNQEDFTTGKHNEDGRVYGRVELVGQLRFDQPRNTLVYYMMGDVTKPQMMSGKKTYLVRDLATLTAECGTAPVYLDIIEANMPPTAPKIISPLSELRNTHMEYALFWFLNSVAMMFIWIRYIRKPPKTTGTIRGMMNK
ncbi:surfeit locus protein 1-like [Dreissena polymorpha]|uniref:SURF1-like protein n=1 Tax=Dreissena polymorpha TaxID=45954 RepID=A0A9D4FQV8_DREPO|nr:surfeit locus protein 1-like [Dreissena polymorpha]KAH3800835.1 hypothetical protein DPMN_154478 [Dreissena polymorpha]